MGEGGNRVCIRGRERMREIFWERHLCGFIYLLIYLWFCPISLNGPILSFIFVEVGDVGPFFVWGNERPTVFLRGVLHIEFLYFCGFCIFLKGDFSLVSFVICFL